MTEVHVQFCLPWRKDTVVVTLPDTGTGVCVEDVLAQLMDELSRASVFSALNGRVCYGSDPVTGGDSIQVLPIVLGG